MIMTQDKARKSATRQRMAETGEPYCEARRMTGAEEEPGGVGPTAPGAAPPPEEGSPGEGEPREEDWYARMAEEAGLSVAEVRAQEIAAQARVQAAEASERAEQAQRRADQARAAADEAQQRADLAEQAADRAEEVAGEAEEAAEESEEFAAEAEDRAGEFGDGPHEHVRRARRGPWAGGRPDQPGWDYPG